MSITWSSRAPVQYRYRYLSVYVNNMVRGSGTIQDGYEFLSVYVNNMVLKGSGTIQVLSTAPT